MESSLATALIITAILVIKTALTELRDPGGARREWAFVTDRGALAGGSLTALAVVALGRSYGGWGLVAWAVLVGLLVAQVLGRRSQR